MKFDDLTKEQQNTLVHACGSRRAAIKHFETACFSLLAEQMASKPTALKDQIKTAIKEGNV